MNREIYGGFLDENIRLTIDDKVVLCDRESTILEAARSAGIEIPTLCYLKGLTPTGACGVCVVEVVDPDGKSEFKRACRCRARDGMVVYTTSEALTKLREARVKKLLDIHPNDCLTCPKTNGNCHFQEVTHLYGINPPERKVHRGTSETNCFVIASFSKNLTFSHVVPKLSVCGLDFNFQYLFIVKPDLLKIAK